MAKRRKKSGGDIPEWVVTYGDLMSLLLCFFILLAAFSELKQPKEYQRVIDAIKEALGGESGSPGITELEERIRNSPISPYERIRMRNDPEMRRSQSNSENVKGRHDKVAMVHENDRHVVGGAMAFDPGQTELTPEVRRRLANDVAPQIKGLNRRVIVRGHTWGVTDAADPTDRLDLSYQRSKNVLEYLVNECGVDPLTLSIEVVGDGEPLSVPTADVENAPSNRRVEVFLTDVEIDELHPDPNFTGRNR